MNDAQASAPGPGSDPGCPIPPERSALRVFLRRRLRLLVGIGLVSAGGSYFLRMHLEENRSAEVLLQLLVAPQTVASLAGIGLFLVLREVLFGQAVREERFADVDARRRASSEPTDYQWLRARIERLEQMSDTVSTRQLKEIISVLRTQKMAPEAVHLKSFRTCFDSLRTFLEEKSADADEKASILLDKGTAYLKSGLVFFIISIIAWQVLAHLTGFQEQYLYGIVSCSVLFVFIEFLSAWFLRQYRLFVDTSTYLIKVKSLFDRYMLVYLIGEEVRAAGGDGKESTAQLIQLLRARIDWPDTSVSRQPDISFAREAVETMGLLLKNLRGEGSARQRPSKRSTPATAERG